MALLQLGELIDVLRGLGHRLAQQVIRDRGIGELNLQPQQRGGAQLLRAIEQQVVNLLRFRNVLTPRLFHGTQDRITQVTRLAR
eukprot:1610-Eustigmatos_ZCMA.PRE.1